MTDTEYLGSSVARGEFGVHIPNIPPAGAEADLVRSRGTPDDWIPYCRVMGWTRNETGPVPLPEAPIDLSVGWPAPPRTLSELDLAVRLGLGLRITLSAADDLSRYLPALIDAKRLALLQGEGTSGWAGLEATQTETLMVTSPAEPIPAMPKLVNFVGLGANSAYALASPNLVRAEIDFQGQRWPAELKTISSSIEYAQFMSPKGLVGVPHVSGQSSLRSLRVDKIVSFDIAGLSELIDLEWLDLSRIRTVSGTHALLSLSRLARLDIAGVANWTDYRLLDQLSTETLTIEPNFLVPDAVAHEWRQRHGVGWRIAKFQDRGA